MPYRIATLTTGPFQENGYLVINESTGETVLIDPGDEAEHYRHYLDKHHLSPLAIVNTHSHLDHVGAVAEIKERYGIPFYLHGSDKPVLEHYPESCVMFGMPQKAAPEVDYWMTDGEMLDFGSLTLKIDHTPGHTPGSCCIVLDEAIFTGDTLFQNSIGRTDLPGGDYETIIQSLKQLMKQYPADFRIYPGHGPESTLGLEQRQNPFLIHI